MRVQESCSDFNSIKVRLEQPKHADDTSYFIGFQFHKGAIRTQAEHL